MNIFVAKWPNGTISIASANNITQLFNALDTEGAPEEASIYKVLSDEYGHFHLTITTDIINNKIKVGVNLDSDCKLKLCKNIFDKADWSAQIT